LKLLSSLGQMERGKLITFEGIDGCGKTTQLRLLEKYLADRGIASLSTREPGGTALGKIIRSALLAGENVEPLAELLLYAADRAQHVRQVIIPALASGKLVLSDRFYDATTAYQGAARGFDPELIERLNQLAAGGLKPDLTLLFDLDAETSLARKNDEPDRLESEPLEFHRRVRAAYLELAAREPDRIKIIPATGTIEETYQCMIEVVRNKFDFEESRDYGTNGNNGTDGNL
jgi:dTMP kinase